MPTLPLFGRGVKGRSSNVSAQKRINLYAEVPAEADKSQFVLYPRAGLTKIFTNNATGFGGGPFRGCIVAQRVINPGTANQQTVDYVFGAIGVYPVVSVNNPDRFLTTATTDPTPVFLTSTGPVIYADNGIQIACVDGRGFYYASYNAGSTTQTAATPANFPSGASSICALASRFIVNDPNNKGRFYWSALLDATTWTALDFATAESFPDPLVAVYAWRGELLLFGSTSIEFWGATGASDIFARTGGSGIPWGLVAQQTIQDVDGQLFFLGRNSGSDYKVVALNGYQAQPISDPDVEYDINQNAAGGLIVAHVQRKGGHTFYVLKLPTKTWAYNATTGEWDEWQTAGGPYAGHFSFFAYGRQSVTDYRDARVYSVDAGVYYDDTTAIVRQVDTRHVFHDMNRLTVWELALDMETGAQSATAPIAPTAALGGVTPAYQTTNSCATTTDSFTVEGWTTITAADIAAGLVGVVCKTSGATFPYRVELSSLSMLFQVLAVTKTSFAITTADTDIGFHWAFAYDSSAQTLTSYKNGVQQSQATGVTTAGGATSTSAFYMGSRAGLFGMTGSVGGVRIWSGALSAATILANRKLKMPPGTTNLISQWWDFPDGQTGVFYNTGSAAGTTVASGTGTYHNGYVASEAVAPQVMLQISRDGGHTFGNELWEGMGALGQYLARIVWRRLGRGRDFVFRFRVADPVKTVFIGASLRIDE